MADCDDRQISQADRDEQARTQQRVGVQRAISPFRGKLPPGMESLMDWLNRQLVPVLQQTRKAVNDVWHTAVDNVPGTGNPLVHFFSEVTAGGDPGTGRTKLNAADQSTATVLRFSDLNGQLVDVSVFAEVMQGSVTAPLGILTIAHASNPRRFVRFDLTAISDQTTYWQATVDPVEASHPTPFVEGDPVTLAFLPGVGSDGAVVPVSSMELIAEDTFLGSVSPGLSAPIATNLGILAGAGLTFSAGVNHDLNVGAGTRITVNGDNVQLATGAAESFLMNATASSAVADYRAGSSVAGAGLTYTAGGTLAVGAGTNVTVNANDVAVTNFPLTGLANQAAETFLGNFTSGSAPPTARAGSSVAGAGLTYTAGGTLAVGSSTSITVNADDIQRSALVGDITAALNSNTTAFRSFTARSVLANATNAGAVPTELQGTTAHHLLKVNSAGTALVFEALALAAFPTIADDTFLANISGGTAVPTAVALTTLAGAGLTGGADAVLAVGAGTRITVNANDVQLATGAAESFLMNATAGVATADYRAGSSVAGAGLTYTAGGTLAVGAGTNVTVNANDVAVDDYPLTGLADQAANTYLANATTGAAPPTAIAVSAESIPARTSGNLTQVTSAAQSILMRAAGSLFFGTAAADQTLRRSGSGDLGFGTLVTNNIGDDQVTYAKLQNVAGFSVPGKATTGSGDAADITAGTDSVLCRNGSGNLAFNSNESLMDAICGTTNSAFAYRTSGVWIQVQFADQTTMEAASNTDRPVSPAVQQFHPSAAKAWILVDGDGVGIAAHYNTSSNVDNGQGDITVTYDTDFSGSEYAHVATAGSDAYDGSSTATVNTVNPIARAVGSTRFNNVSRYAGVTVTDPDYYCVVAFGDQ